MTRILNVGDLSLRLGGRLRDVEQAFVTHGTLAPDGRNAILMTHGYTSAHTYIEGGAGASEGSWAALIGPGRTLDTDRFFIVSVNMLGSSYGSTAARSPNPETGRPWGPDFPQITLADIVAAQKALLDRLGVRELAAVIGPSYGGFQAFSWGVEHPGFARALVATVSGLTAPAMDVAATEAFLAQDPNWNGGRYHEAGGIAPTMTRLRENTLRAYGLDEALAAALPDPAERAAEIRRQAAAWAAEADGHALLTLGRAANRYDVRGDLARIRARVLYVLSRTDALFPPSLAPGVMGLLREAGVQAEYVELDSEDGHLASATALDQWEPALRRLLDEVA